MIIKAPTPTTFQDKVYEDIMVSLVITPRLDGGEIKSGVVIRYNPVAIPLTGPPDILSSSSTIVNMADRTPEEIEAYISSIKNLTEAFLNGN